VRSGANFAAAPSIRPKFAPLPDPPYHLAPGEGYDPPFPAEAVRGYRPP